MYKLAFIIILIGVLISCNTETTTVAENTLFSTYFYPVQEEAQIFIYADSANPLNEKFTRVYKVKGEKNELLSVEQYQRDFRITEAYQYNLDDTLTIFDHMIVDARGEKRKANVRANVLLPKVLNSESYFSSSFPAHVDSTITYYDVKSTVIDKNYSYSYQKKKYSAILVRDSIKISFYNPTTNKASTQLAAKNSVYAKGLGLVAFGTIDRRVYFQLTKTLNNTQWSAIREDAM